MLPEPRPELLQTSDVVHGALDFAELACLDLAPEAVMDFSVNGNPYGPSPRVREVISAVPLERFPDREALALRRVLASHMGTSPDRILAGNGSAELLWLVALAYLRAGDSVLIVGPTFGEYARAATLMGARVHEWTARPEEGFRVDPEDVAQTLGQLQPRLVFLCNPNNPTGTYLAVETIATWAHTFPRTLFVADEAYLPFTAGATSVLTTPTANLLVLGSMTKAHALAGVRLGYAVGHPQVIRALATVRPPWNVNALAQAAGIAALEDPSHLHRSLTKLAHAKPPLVQGLQALGFVPVPSRTHFFLIPVGHATALRRALLQGGILVRDCTSFGLPAYIRVASRRPDENARLLAALAGTLSSGQRQ
ncbi:Histidinol-phosphate aminotransferase [Candidatus Entotheonellaceae bacterium PAL068K]